MPAPAQTRSVAIAAGANTGNAAANIRAAFAALAASPDLSHTRLSSLYSTAPVRVTPGGPDPGGTYTNAVITATSSADPFQLLSLLHRVEREGGRDRTHSPHGAPRPIDLDLILVGDLTFNTADLTLPHPRMHERAFVLAPLADVAPDWPVPGSGGAGLPPLTVAQLLARLGPLDAGAVRRIDP